MSRLSKALRKLGGAVAPLAGLASFIPGPIGAVGRIAGLVGGAFGGGGGGALPGGAPVGMAAMLPASILPGLPALGGLAGRIGAASGLGGLAARLGVGGLAGAAAGVIRTAAGRIRGVVLGSGRFLSSRKAAQLARRVGIEAAAVALGIGAVELAEMVLADEERKGRRGRAGISGADLRRTRRTIGKVMRAHAYIVNACRGAHVPMRRRSAPRIIQAMPPHRHRLVSVK